MSMMVTMVMVIMVVAVMMVGMMVMSVRNQISLGGTPKSGGGDDNDGDYDGKRGNLTKS